MIYAPPFVFCPKGNPALGGIPPSVFSPERDPTLGGSPLRLLPREESLPLHSPHHPLCATSSLSIISRGRKRSYLEPTHALGKSATITYVR